MNERNIQEMNPQDMEIGPYAEFVNREFSNVVERIEREFVKGKMPLTLIEKRDLKKWIEEMIKSNCYLQQKYQNGAHKHASEVFNKHITYPTTHAIERFLNYYGINLGDYKQLGYDKDPKIKQRLIDELDKARQDAFNL